MIVFILIALFVVVLFYLLYLYTMKTFIEWIHCCIDWKILRVMLYIAASAYIIIPHVLILSLLIALI